MLENLQFFPTYHRGIREPGFAYGLFLVILPIISVKIAMTRRQSAGVRSISTSEASQRLHAEDLTSVYSRFIPAQTPRNKNPRFLLCMRFKIRVFTLTQGPGPLVLDRLGAKRGC